MARNGLDEAEAKRHVWIVELPGLLTDDGSDGLLDHHRSVSAQRLAAVS